MASPSINDPRYSLVFKVAQNYYDFAINFGVSGLTPPSLNDTEDTLWKKAVYYSARVIDTH